MGIHKSLTRNRKIKTVDPYHSVDNAPNVYRGNQIGGGDRVEVTFLLQALSDYMDSRH